MTFPQYKSKILTLTKGSIITLQVAKDKAGVKLISTVADAEAVLRVLERKRKITPPVPKQVKERYNEAHRLFMTKECQEAVRDHGCPLPVFPPVHKSGGLTTFIVNYAIWTGNYGNRINTTGRRIFDKKKNKEIWIKGTTAKGTGDTVLCLQGVMVWMEIKIGGDTPSDKQLEQQRRVRASGGQYHFVHSASEFLQIFDSILYGN